MPPKKRTTRASKKAVEQEEQEEDNRVEVSTIEEPKPKKTKGRKKKNAVEEEPAEKTEGEPVEQPKKKKKDETPAKKSDEDKKTEEKKTDTITPSKEKKKSIGAGKLPSAPSPSKPSSLASPTKRISSGILSRIPSPIKKRPSLEPKDVQVDSNRIEHSINQAFVSKNVPKLTSIIDDLKLTKTELLFNEYKSSSEVRFKTSDDLISSLSSQNDALKKELENAQIRISELERSGSSSNTSAPSEDVLFENELILDMLEQVVGLRIHKAEDTDDALKFDCSQSGKNGFLDYRLTINKEDSSEIIYSPMENDDSESLKEFLPDYFFDNLTFPLETLQQFYHKIYRGLNK